jgi:hypothetical protein
VSLNNKYRLSNALKTAESMYQAIYDASESAYNALENSETNETFNAAMI